MFKCTDKAEIIVLKTEGRFFKTVIKERVRTGILHKGFESSARGWVGLRLTQHEASNETL